MKKINTILNPSIVIIGSGNLASHIIDVFLDSNIRIIQVYSRSNRIELKKKYDKEIEIIDKIEDINTTANIYFTIVKDDAIPLIVKQWPFKLKSNQTIVHCSGSVSIDVFNSISINNAVFWPIQSIRENAVVHWKETPICISANNVSTLNTIKHLAMIISDRVEVVTEEQRIKLHLTAVILNNFSNHLFHLADQFLELNNLKLDLFIPILQETVDKLKVNKPIDLQTGPAVRNDISTLNKHIKLLEDNKDLQHIYKVLSESIIKSNS